VPPSQLVHTEEVTASIPVSPTDVRVNGLVVNGIVGQATWRKLIVAQRLGSRGEQVRAIQALPNIYGPTHVGFRLTEDGIFGRLTRAAVICFQRAVDITGDGVVGPVSWPLVVHEAMRAEDAA
jgi:peptidoglycan hydrolase-like protein with peptidoglycan-binding domain